ncbi:MAG: hypothetical protein ABIH63_04015 [archaeon]
MFEWGGYSPVRGGIPNKNNRIGINKKLYKFSKTELFEYEEKLTQMEEKRPDEMEMAAQENEEREEKKEACR